MARDPDSFRVSPTLSNLPMVQAPTPDNAGPEQLVQAGRAITNAGTVGANIFENELREQNKARVTEAMTALTKYRNDSTYGDNGWTRLRGKNALDRPNGLTLDDEYGEDIEKEIEALANGLGNDAQRAVFKEAATGLAIDYRSRIQSHVAAEGDAYKIETYSGMADTGSRQLALATSEQEIIEARGMITSAADQIFDLKGTAPEARQETIRKLLTPGHTAQLANILASEDIDGAEAYLNKHADDLTPEAYSKISSTITEQRAIITGGNIGEEIFAGGAAQAGATAPQTVLMPFQGDFGLSSQFGEKRAGRAPGYSHGGIDASTPVGTPLRAGADGTVRVKQGSKYGTYVDLELDDGTTLRMAHLSSAEVKDGTRVRQGQVIAKSGGARGDPGAGNSTGPHLHYEVRVGGKTVDPASWHQGQPKTGTGGRGAGRPNMQQMLEELYAQDLPPRIEQEAERKIRSLHSASQQAEAERDDAILSKAYEEIDRTGSLPASTRAALVGADMANVLPSLRSFEKATQERAKGVPVDEASGLEAYGRVQVGIANGEIRDVSHLMQFKPFVPDTLFKQLLDDFAQSPQSAQAKASDAIKEMKDAIGRSGLFVDEDGKQTPELKKEYNRFVGAVVKQIQGRELAGQTVTNEMRREIVLGMVGTAIVDGDRMPRYQVRNLYDTIPPRTRMAITRQLESRGVDTPTIDQVVGVWQKMSPRARDRWSN